MKKRCLFICIEGLDTSGKTTQARMLVANLRLKGLDAVYTTEPSSGDFGSFLRSNILQRRGRVPAVVEALLFAADRVDHVEQEIKPALQKGRIVVSDRYVFSSLAYQGAAGLDLNWIEEINKLALQPDLAIYIDVPLDVVMKRIERMRRRQSVMEQFDIQQKVRQVYMQLVKDGRLFSVDGNRPLNVVSADISKMVLDTLGSS